MVHQVKAMRLNRANWSGGVHPDRALGRVVILGVPATVVVSAVGGIDDRGDNAAFAVDADNLRTAQEASCAQKGTYVEETAIAGT